MIGLLDALASWQTFVVMLAVFGFFPRMALRLIVLAFHREDSRRVELMAELQAVPRVERPLWVAEQLELAISEGLWGRFEWMLTGRVIHRWHLSDGVERNRLYPDTFSIPSEEDKDEIRPGDLVKAEFAMSDWAERMWVEVTAVRRGHIVGQLSNTPAGIPRLQPGRKVKLKRKHVIDFMPQEDEHSCPEIFGCSAELSRQLDR